jgi:deoxyribodipyrimidine photo-lyase
MATRRIQDERVQNLNEEDVGDGDYVLYWMQSSQRAEQNHALEYAVQWANDMRRRVLVVFGLTEV